MPDTIPAPSHLRLALSGVSGSTAIACYVVTLLPQLIEQWRLKSAEGLSLSFISIWFLGDLLNLVGSIWADLLPQAIILAAWFCATDFLMIGSYFYYKKVYPKHHKHKQHKHKQKRKRPSRPDAQQSQESEQSPLLDASENRRPSHKSRRNSIESVVLEPRSHSIFKKYVLPVLVVTAAGTFGYFMSPHTSPAQRLPEDGVPPQEKIAIGPQILGYASATLYLTARIPQIYQNYRTKSVEGLSLLFFIFSVFGNFTYALQIFFYRSDWPYIKLYFSWILGSMGTFFEDFTIFAQFYMYQKRDSANDTEALASNIVFDEEEED